MRSSIALLAAASLATASPLQRIFESVRQTIVGDDALTWPHPHLPEGPPKTIDLSKYTIGQILNYTLHHHHDERRTLPIHKLAWAVNKTDTLSIYDDETLHMTLFAPDDAALTPPHRRGEHDGPPPPPHHGPHHDHEDNVPDQHPFYALEHAIEREHGGDHDEERHERFVKIVKLLLRYHTLTSAYTGRELADKSTAATALNTSRDGKVPFRVRLSTQLLPPALRVNFYARARLEVLAKNGVIHLISAPLFPPLSPLSSLLLFPGSFSTVTSGIQLTELDTTLAPWLHRRESSDDESVHPEVVSMLKEIISEHATEASRERFVVPEYTALVPTNLAFIKLGVKLNIFLGSPFGRAALKAVLQYHVLPGVTLHTDYLHNSTAKIAESSTREATLDALADPASFEDMSTQSDALVNNGMLSAADKGMHVMSFLDRKHANVSTIVAKTALNNTNIELDIVSYRYFGKGPIVRRVVAKPAGRGAKPVPAIVADGVGWSGAFHIVPTVLKPPFHGCSHHKDGGKGKNGEHKGRHGPHHNAFSAWMTSEE